MIVCASRRTDIAAFHSEWFMNRLRAGYCLVRNPIAKDVVYKVDLRPRNVDMLVFITKDPRPMIPHLNEMKDMGFRCSFQITMTPYGKDIEPNVPSKTAVVDAFRTISERVGKQNMLWRYDPVIINEKYDIGYHRESFEYLSEKLSGHTERCTFSFLEIHEKLKGHVGSGLIREVSEAEAKEIGKTLSEISSKNGMQLGLCCSRHDLSDYGILPRGCIDRNMMRTLGVPTEEISAPIREGCLCVKNIEVGEYDTCGHDCVYCYANRSTDAARNRRVYDPEGEMLFGKVGNGDRVIGLASRRALRITDF